MTLGSLDSFQCFLPRGTLHTPSFPCFRLSAADAGPKEAEHHRSVLAAMVQDHALGRDLCVVGGKGEGKSTLGTYISSTGYVLALLTLAARSSLQGRTEHFARRGTRCNRDAVTPIALAFLLCGLAVAVWQFARAGIRFGERARPPRLTPYPAILGLNAAYYFSAPWLFAVRQFARLLGYNVENVHVYRDMSARDLLQRRTTSQAGDTVWEYTPLVRYVRTL